MAAPRLRMRLRVMTITKKQRSQKDNQAQIFTCASVFRCWQVIQSHCEPIDSALVGLLYASRKASPRSTLLVGRKPIASDLPGCKSERRTGPPEGISRHTVH